MAFYQLHTKQLIQAPLDKVWEFISNPRNLKLITPEHMGFDITSRDLPEKMYPGMIISYTVKPLLGFKMTWVSEITQIEEKRFFVDQQRIGPYSMWHHQHLIEPVKNGVLMSDIVSYCPPLGFLGSIANGLFIRKQLETIFAYREKAVEQYFNNQKDHYNPGS
jgi:ligand-binding SRPBCC domain-containing protein